MRVAIVGVGNCASSLIQAVTQAKRADHENVAGLRFEKAGGYTIADIDIVAAFDVVATKVGHDLSQAITAVPNCTSNYIDVPPTGVTVAHGPLLDGLSAEMATDLAIATCDEVDAAAILRESGAEIVVSFLPVGSASASRHYALAACQAGCAFVNCNPESIARDAAVASAFTRAGLPLLGDDIKSQIGSTALHRSLIEFLQRNGALLGSTYQLNYGGNTDFRNMQDRERAKSKRLSKLAALTAVTEASSIVAGPAEYIPHLRDHKVAYVRVEGTAFLGMPYEIDVKLTVEDSPNAAGVAVDAIRVAATARDRGLAGVIDQPCAYLFKHPRRQLDDTAAHAAIVEFVNGEAPQMSAGE
jgi:myo-inositol-1-phosphate synthase